MDLLPKSDARGLPYRWVVFSLAYLAFFVQYTIYLSWNPFIPMAQQLFSLSMQQTGNIVAAVAVGRILLQIPGGILVDRFPAKYVLAVSLILLSVCTVGAGMKGTYAALLISQFCIGASGVVVWPLCIKLVVDWFPGHRRDLIAGLLNTGTSFSVASINALIPYAVSTLNWSDGFYLLGAAAITIALAVVIVMKSAPADSGKVAASPKPKVSLNNIVTLLKRTAFWQGLMVYVGAVYTSWGLNTWLITYLIQQDGVPAQTASSMMFLFGICGAVGMPFVGMITKGDPQKRCLVIAAILGLLTIMIIGLPWIQNPAILWIYVAVLGVAAFSYMGPVNMLITDLVDMHLFGTAMAVIVCVWQFSSMVQSLWVGYLLDHATGITYHVVFWILSAGSLLGCLAAISLRNKFLKRRSIQDLNQEEGYEKQASK